jgi:hypothetical protein
MPIDRRLYLPVAVRTQPTVAVQSAIDRHALQVFFVVLLLSTIHSVVRYKEEKTRYYKKKKVLASWTPQKKKKKDVPVMPTGTVHYCIHLRYRNMPVAPTVRRSPLIVGVYIRGNR